MIALFRISSTVSNLADDQDLVYPVPGLSICKRGSLGALMPYLQLTYTLPTLRRFEHVLSVSSLGFWLQSVTVKWWVSAGGTHLEPLT